jgi:L-histidine N-alpha-methyltransferase
LSSQLAIDTDIGLSAEPKFLLAKYFYDDNGSKIFESIMQLPEYYLTNCEVEIFYRYKAAITKKLSEDKAPFDLIEFGPGNGLKTKILLEQLISKSVQFNYIPIDISTHALELLSSELKKQFSNIKIIAQTGDYFSVMKNLKTSSANRRVILFLGANIGNYDQQEAKSFVKNLSEMTMVNDQVLIGFDLIKSPAVIYNAYSDQKGLTRDFNLNHLARINEELGADFKLNQFEHYSAYNPLTGSVKSYLVSRCRQKVYISALKKYFSFSKWEPIFMELSQKYSLQMINNLAANHQFKVVRNFMDQRKYFSDSIWVKTADGNR